MPKFTIPAGRQGRRGFHRLQANLRASYSNRANDFLTELYPGLTYDPKKKLDNDEIESELGSTRTTASRSRSRGCRSACSRMS